MAYLWAKNQRAPVYTQLEELSDIDGDSRKSQSIPYAASRLIHYTLSFVAGIVVASLCFLLVGSRTLSTLNANVTAADHSSAVNAATELIRSPVPPIPLATVAFEENKTFTARPSPETDRAWNHLLPPGRGFVFINDSSEYGLPPGQETQWGEIYSVSMFHELHCLGQLRKAYWTLIKGVETGDIRKSKLLVGKHGEHVHHCFDYIRQGIMCAGDMAIEWPRTEADGRRIAVDGWGAKHTCKSWDAIQRYMEDNHFDHSMKLDIAT